MHPENHVKKSDKNIHIRKPMLKFKQIGYIIWGGVKLNKMHRRLISLIVTLLLIFTIMVGCTQENAGGTYIEAVSLGNENIQQENLMNIIKELTSEQYRGRLTGTKENRMAAQYIADYFKKIGLESPEGLDMYMQSYVQPSILLSDKPVLQVIDKDGKVINDFKYPDNFVLRRLSSGTNALDMEVSMCLIEDYEMLRLNNNELTEKALLLPWEHYNLLNSQNNPADLAEMFGASLVISEFNLSENNLGYNYLKIRPLFETWMTSKDYKPFIFVDSDTFSKLEESMKNGNKLKFSCYSEVNLHNTATNVIGLIPGSDPELKDNHIIIGAHFDHVGDNMNGSYNPGALDNASGTAVMMELARIIEESKIPPKQSILFIALNGEESGLCGARYYCKNPVSPLGKAVMINLDMVGSAANVPLTIAIASPKSDSSLRDDLAECADNLGISYIKEYEGASDHAVFDNFGVSSVCLIIMDLSYGYHSPYDTIKAVDGARVQEITELVLEYIISKAY